jgi:HEAT repeat protein
MEQAIQKIRKGSPHAKTMITALGYAGTPTTQDSLMDLLSSGYKENRLAVMRALSLGDDPTEKNIDFHKEMLDDPKLGRQARYGLGANAHTLLERGKKPQADEIFDLLVKELANATSQDDIVMVFKALGNTGHPKLVEIVPEYLAHADETIRAVALNALQKTPTGEADNLVASALVRDTSATVRGVAIKVIGERPLTGAALTALDQVVHNEISKNLRHRAVNVLTRQSGNPDAAAILKWVTEHEQVDEIRETAEKALATT